MFVGEDFVDVGVVVIVCFGLCCVFVCSVISYVVFYGGVLYDLVGDEVVFDECYLVEIVVFVLVVFGVWCGECLVVGDNVVCCYCVVDVVGGIVGIGD